MSLNIDKYKPRFENGTLTKDSNPYTLLLNQVLQSNIDSNCLAVWVSLQSRPENWTLSPQQLQKQFGWGKNKTYDVLNKLIDLKLLERLEIRDDNGRLQKFVYHVKDGKEYIINQRSHPLPCFQELDNQELENRDITNKRSIQIKENIKIKDKTYCSSDDELKSFEKFWLLYPRKQSKKAALKSWLKNKLHSKQHEIEMHLMKRLETEWKGKSKTFIPLPTSFLNAEKWNDEIINENVIPMNNSVSQHRKNVNYVLEQIKNGR